MIIDSENIIFNMNKDNKPVLRCKSGDLVTFKTCDCFSDTIKTEDDLVSEIDFEKVNPATGPLYIEGADVGDVLKVEIKNISLDEKGVVVTAPGLGRLKDKIESEETVICNIDGDNVDFNGFKIPLKKMVGVIGVAPKDEAYSTGVPHDHGGNLDCTKIAEGSSVYFPVNVEGALLSLGDLHAAMGDGEIMGSGLEISGEVEVKVEVLKEFDYNLPLIETDNKWITIASRETMEEASDLAIYNMVDLITKNKSISLNQAGMLISIAGDLKVCQIVNPNVTMRVEMDKNIIG